MTTQREIADRLGLPIHPPKIETFDLGPRTNTDSKQRTRAVDEYHVEPFGLYMARPMVDHPKLTYMQSWLLPELGIRITDFSWRPGCERAQDFYVDIVSIETGQARWRSVDLYLDIAVGTGQYAEVLDVDEFLTALRAGLLDDATAQHAMTATHTTLDGLARHGYDLSEWLRESGIELSWRQPS
ncbi:hypothetical protein DFQ14_11610 [Halopolyspora algeriensis]|uniref:DUF402 domain-containing protein n=1 Tax=Halopolyspora algeriensis TaxID=1500506 RepID=A0A368VH56_9ACTN|nr:DUF402 domain-containing protein [Halopolyspora algeriensis]RCW39525.1 hypothetical protein DFQ14_11610 [Halopolyspora algeriensis]TQM56162.1 hypothetical protein FHU43_0953 [Halopolyspora algeriensis]